MEGTIGQYIEQRIKKMGYKDYTFDIIAVTVNATTYKLNAYNEIYLLFDVSNDVDDFTIKSDDNTLEMSEFQFAGVPYLLHEFKGNILFNTTGAVSSTTFLLYKILPETFKKL